MHDTIRSSEVFGGKLSVTAATPQDAEAIAAILTSALQQKLAHGDMAWGDEPYTTKEVLHRIAQGNTFICWINETPAGTLILDTADTLVWGEQPSNAVYVHQLAVHSDHSGNNLGSRLLDWASREATNRAKDFVRLDVPAENSGLRRYYESFGFTHVTTKEIKTPNTAYRAALYEKPV